MDFISKIFSGRVNDNTALKESDLSVIARDHGIDISCMTTSGLHSLIEGHLLNCYCYEHGVDKGTQRVGCKYIRSQYRGPVDMLRSISLVVVDNQPMPSHSFLCLCSVLDVPTSGDVSDLRRQIMRKVNERFERYSCFNICTKLSQYGIFELQEACVMHGIFNGCNEVGPRKLLQSLIRPNGHFWP